MVEFTVFSHEMRFFLSEVPFADTLKEMGCLPGLRLKEWISPKRVHRKL